MAVVERASELFKVESSFMRVTLTHKKFAGGKRGSYVMKPLTFDQARENRDALAKVSGFFF